VGILDSNGLVVESDTRAVTIALANPGGATLSGTTTVNAVDGVANFSDLSVDIAGQYDFVASAQGLLGAESADFVITGGAPATATFITQPPTPPTTINRGELFDPPLQVEVRDGSGNLIANDSIVTMVIANDPTGTAKLGGTTNVPVVNGVATFTDLSVIDGGGALVLAAVSGDALAVSEPFVVLAPFSIYGTTLTNALVSIDPTTFVATPIGAGIGFTEVASITAVPDGRLLATAVDGMDRAVLISIDPVSGAGTLVGGPSLTGVVGSRAPGLTLDPATGTVYAYINGGATSPVGLYTVNIEPGVGSGTATPVGSASGFSGNGNALIVDPFVADTSKPIYGTPSDNQGLVTFDKTTGVATDVAGSIGNVPNPIFALGINPFNTQLLGGRRTADTGTERLLVNISRTTGIPAGDPTAAPPTPAIVQAAGLASATFKITPAP